MRGLLLAILCSCAVLLSECASIPPSERGPLRGGHKGSSWAEGQRSKKDASSNLQQPDCSSPYVRFVNRLWSVGRILVLPSPVVRTEDEIKVLQGREAVRFIQTAIRRGPYPITNDFLDKHFGTRGSAARRRFIRIVLHYNLIMGVPLLIFESNNRTPLRVQQTDAPHIYRLTSEHLKAWGLTTSASSIEVYWPGLSKALQIIGCPVYQREGSKTSK